MIHSAILLAAGRGNRQRPYTDVTPKPLLRVRGRETLDYVLSALKCARIERVCIVTHHLEEKIFDFVGDGSPWNLEVTFAHQKEIRGSGDAMRSVPKEWIRDEPVMVLATDYILQQDTVRELVDAHQKHAVDITISLKECPPEELGSRSSVALDADWRVTRIVEKPSREEVRSPYAASVMFIFPRAIWEYLPRIQPSARGEIELQDAVNMMLEDGFEAFGLVQPAPEEWTKELME